jgi:hypothetical protein
MIAPEACGIAAREMADAIGDGFVENIKRNTPVDTNPFRNDPDRPPGSLRESMERTATRRMTRGGVPAFGGEAFTRDPIAEFVEWDTPPHEIRARDGGRLTFQSRDGFTDADGVFHPPGTWVSVEKVDHPGTRGAHMFSIGALITEAELERLCAPALARWERAITRGRGRVVDRRVAA